MGSHIVATRPTCVNLVVSSPNGRRVSPYSIEGRVLIKRVTNRHVFKAKQAVGIDEDVWQTRRSFIDTVRFVWWDGKVFEINANDFERRSFLHGDGIVFAVTRFVPLSALKLVRERPPARGQLSLFAGGST